jgi:hypothetical protein
MLYNIGNHVVVECRRENHAQQNRLPLQQGSAKLNLNLNLNQPRLHARAKRSSALKSGQK